MYIMYWSTLLQMVRLNYGMGSENPVGRVLFYKKEKPDEALLISKEKVTASQILP